MTFIDKKPLFFIIAILLITSGCRGNPYPTPVGFTQRWTFQADADLLSIGSNGNQIFAATSDSLYALNLHGKVLWKQPLTSDQFYPPLVCGDTIVTPIFHASLAAFARADGSPLWQNISPYDATTQAHIVSMACNHNILVVLRWFGPAIAYDLRTGKRVWEYPLSLRARTNVSIYDRSVFLAAMEKGVVVLDLFSGATQRKITPPGNTFYVAIDQHLLYTLSMTGKLPHISVFTLSGKLQRNRAFSLPLSVLAMTLTDDKIYLASDQKCVALSHNLQIAWEYQGKEISGFLQSSPLATHQWVFLEDATHLYVLSAKNGEFTGAFSLKREGWEEWLPKKHPSPLILAHSALLIIPKNKALLTAYTMP